MRSRLCIVTLAAFVALSSCRAGETAIKYPTTKRVDHSDDYHGTTVADPYRWLEDDVRESKDVAEWVEAQNKVTNAYLEAIPERDKIRKRLTELWNFSKYTAPNMAGGRYFFRQNDGLQNQYVLYTLDALDGKPRELIDPNKWSKDGTIALGSASPSDDGKLLAYDASESGSDWSSWRVLEVETGKLLAEELKWTKHTRVAWTLDNKGFYYTRYDAPKPGEEFQSVTLNNKVYYHKVGTPQAADELVYRRPDQPEWEFDPVVTEDGKYLVLTVMVGTDPRYRITWKDLTDPKAKFVDLIDNFDHEYSLIGNDGPVFWFKADLDAPRGRIIAIDLRKPEKANWKEIVPQAAENLRDVNLVGDHFLAEYLKDARTVVKVFALDGKYVRDVDLPGIGTADGFRGKRTDKETFYSFSAFTLRPSVYRYDIAAGKSTLFRQSDVKFNPDDYEVRQVFATSKDGTKVPMFVSSKKGLKLDGSNPTLLYGYGGFNIPLTPQFSTSRLAWMEMGGVMVVANLRGGGEYGKEWHKAGTKLKKQNVFDDFIACAEYLVREKYTRPEKLAIQGRSNGGLLVGAVMNQRPDLFGACLPGVGVMDMLRFQKFTAGRYWVDDYGSSDDPKEFKALYAYSPYHNLKKGTKYPPTLVVTADTDDRVVPGHSFKFMARLQECQAGDAPVLARIETKAGHGAGKPTSKQIEEVGDEWAFLVKTLGMQVK